MTAKQLCRVHLWAAILWATVGTAVSIKLRSSILWIALISIYAIVIEHMAAYAGHRAEDS